MSDVKRDERSVPAEVPPHRPRAKHRFTLEERYGVWVAHGRKCRLCDEPIKFFELEIDHYFPEHLENDPEALAQIIRKYSLPDDFEINSFANWVPAHRNGNKRKRGRVPQWTPDQQTLVTENLERAATAARKAEKLRKDAFSGRTLSQVLGAIEKRKLTLTDLLELVDDLVEDPGRRDLPDGAVFLEDGRMFGGDEILKTCVCSCERSHCVGQDRKVQCVFTSELSPWVVGTGLFHTCYDELIRCPRCASVHRRGYVGRVGSCSEPFADQTRQSD